MIHTTITRLRRVSDAPIYVRYALISIEFMMASRHSLRRAITISPPLFALRGPLAMTRGLR